MNPQVNGMLIESTRGLEPLTARLQDRPVRSTDVHARPSVLVAARPVSTRVHARPSMSAGLVVRMAVRLRRSAGARIPSRGIGCLGRAALCRLPPPTVVVGAHD